MDCPRLIHLAQNSCQKKQPVKNCDRHLKRFIYSPFNLRNISLNSCSFDNPAEVSADRRNIGRRLNNPDYFLPFSFFR